MNKVKKYLKQFISVVVAFVVIFVAIPTSNAGNIDLFTTDATTRWAKYSDGSNRHMGSKSTQYGYSSQSIKTEYQSVIEGGIALWGNYIICTEGTPSSAGLFTVSSVINGSTASTTSTYNPSTKYINTWTITIYSNTFDNNPIAGQKRTIAHEIGHAYGLDHVNYSNQIMYSQYSATINVTQFDQKGMDVMTHMHTHSGSYSVNYEYTSGYRHKTRCTTCKAYYLAVCSYTSYHSGKRHYFVFDCACGNNQTLSWACSGNPCITISSMPNQLETE